MLQLNVGPHPRLFCDAFAFESERPLVELSIPSSLLSYLAAGSEAPLAVTDKVKTTVRDLLRAGGFKPTGRSKPASEYLAKAAEEGRLGTINLAVDICNVVSFHSGLPISVVDLDLMSAPFHVDVVREKTAYVFNPSGQELDVTGLICLWDSLGPCGSPVKDSQRTKTNDATRRTLSVIWGDHELKDQVLRAGAWYRELAQACGFRLIGEVERQ